MTQLFKISHIVSIILTAFAFSCTALSCHAWGAEEDDETLALYSAWQQESSSASRAPKPLSQTPENITIITTSDIEALNAHTLADVLITIPGIQVQSLGGPGSTAYSYIQGANFNHTMVLLDGAPLNKIGNSSDIGMVPARIIERIEIVKGSASAAWGPALGGVINVITKSPDKRTIGGTATASLGNRTTADSSAEVTGTSGRLGYYLSAGYLGSNGLLPERSLHSNNTYAKLTYDLPDNGQIWGTINQTRVRQGENYNVPIFDLKEVSDQRYLDTTLGMRRQLTERLGMEFVSFYTNRNRYDYNNTVSTAAPSNYLKYRERTAGANAKLIWNGNGHLLVGGIDFVNQDFQIADLLYDTYNAKRSDRRLGVFLNDTISLGPVALVPGIRYDNTRNGDQYSPSFGATWKLTDSTLLRAYTARGFGYANSVTGVWNTEKIWTTQVGMESTVVPYLWQKLTLFRNQTWNVLDMRNLDTTLPEQRIALGVEYEVRTTPVFNTSFGGGYTFTDTTRTSNDSQVKSFARHTLQLALRYDDQTYRGMLTGRHIFWNHVREPVNYNGSYYGLVWDLHLGAKVWKRENNSLEIFFSGHNLFNSAQFADETQPNTGRWFEGGVKVRF